jgi:osmotically-inducible protein OsmY
MSTRTRQQQQKNQQNQQRQGYTGYGPVGWKRPDQFIEDELCRKLENDNSLDATGLQVEVQNGLITLRGSVPTSGMRHTAMQLAQGVPGARGGLSIQIEVAERAPSAQGQTTRTARQ